MSLQSFHTIAKEAEWEQTIDKSRFIGVVCPVRDVQEVEACLERVRARYPNARHYVYAYRLLQGNMEKATDDGEPQGTGGRPVLDILQHRRLWNVLLVVVRYFGGILLGTGGLTRAYGGTARNLIEQARVEHLVAHVVYTLTIPYGLFDTLKYQLDLHGWDSGRTEYTEAVRLEVYVPSTGTTEFETWLESFAGRQITFEQSGQLWRAD